MYGGEEGVFRVWVWGVIARFQCISWESGEEVQAMRAGHALGRDFPPRCEAPARPNTPSPTKHVTDARPRDAGRGHLARRQHPRCVQSATIGGPANPLPLGRNRRHPPRYNALQASALGLLQAVQPPSTAILSTSILCPLPDHDPGSSLHIFVAGKSPGDQKT